MGRKVDHLGGLMEGRRVGLKADHSGGHLEGHLEGLKVGHSVDLMEGQKGPAVTKVASLLYERLVLPEPVQVVPLVVREEVTEQARIVPA